jgi:hypothetical protein
MKKTFIYKEKFSFSYFYPAVAFVVLAVLSGVFEYGIAMRNLHLLAYPNSMYILSVIAVLFVAYALYKYNSAQKSAKNPNPIEIDGQGISFPQGEDGVVSVAFADIKELSRKKDEDEGAQIIIYTAGNERYEFSEEHFANKDEFSEFEAIMNQNCAK